VSRRLQIRTQEEWRAARVSRWLQQPSLLAENAGAMHTKNAKSNNALSNDWDSVRQEIRSRAAGDVVGTYRQLGYDGPLRKDGPRYKGLCPFHSETTPSFVVGGSDQHAGRWKCFGCGDGGDAVDFVARKNGVSRGEATKRAANSLGIDLPKPASKQEPQAGPPDTLRRQDPSLGIVACLQAELEKLPDKQAFLTEQRCLSPATIAEARLGFHPHSGCYAIPVFTPDGKDVLDIRLYRPAGDGGDKMKPWKQGIGKARLYYPPGWTPPEPGDSLTITEGEMDALLVYSLGWRAVTNTNGADAWPEDAGLNLEDVHVVLASDNDGAGHKRNLSLSKWCYERGAADVRALQWPSGSARGHDVTDVVHDAGGREAGGAELARLFAAAERLAAPKGIVVAVSRTYEEIDRQLGSVEWLFPDWLPKHYVTLVAGDPGIGKTSFALAVAKSVITDSRLCSGIAPTETGPVCFLDTEGQASIINSRAEAWNIPRDQLFDIGLHGAGHCTLDSPGALEAVGTAIRREGCRLVVVDTLRGAHRGDENSSEMHGFLRRLQRLATDEDIGCIVCHHLRKRSHSESTSVTLDRIRGSSAIGGQVVVAIALSRPDPKDPHAVRVEAIKNNLAPLPEPFGMSLASGAPTFGDAPQERRTTTERERATEFLLAHLQDGPVRSTRLSEEAKRAGMSVGTLRKAQHDLGIKHQYVRDGDDRYWTCALPCPGAA
jgi:hypothetical protein